MKQDFRNSMNESLTDENGEKIPHLTLKDGTKVPLDTRKNFAKWLLQQDDHARCANFLKSNYKCIGPCCLVTIRILLFVPMLAIFIINTMMNPWDSLYFESEWGFALTTFSLFTSLMAHYSNWWHSAAVHSSELAMGFNICIVPIFWSYQIPYFLDHWDEMAQSDGGRWLLFELCSVHSLPIITSITELVITDMVFLKRDSKWNFIAGILYIGANWAGYQDNGIPMYDYWGLDWKNPWLTIGLFVFQACVLYGINYGIAVCTQKKHKFVERDSKGRALREEILEAHELEKG